MNPSAQLLDKAIKSLKQNRSFVEITNKIKKHSTAFASFTWTHGGCFAFAEMLRDTITGAQLWCVGQFESNDYPAQHAFVRYAGKFFDATGVVTKAKLMKYKTSGLGKVKLGAVEGWDDLWYPEQEFVTLEEQRAIGRLLKRLLKERV